MTARSLFVRLSREHHPARLEPTAVTHPMHATKPLASSGPQRSASWHRIALSVVVLVVCTSGAQGQTASAPAGRLISRAGTELEARADGPACGTRVKVIITSSNPKLFEGDIPTAAKFFTNARAGHSLSCPQMTRMVAQGKSSDKIMFTAMADQSNGWEALILGATSVDSRAEESALAGSGPTPKSVLRSNPAFMAAKDVLAQTSDKYMCLRGATLACEMIIKFTPSGADKAVIAYRQALSGGKSTAAVTSTAALRDGFFCADPNSARVVVEDAQMSDDAKKDYAEQLLDRVKSNGEICTGFSGKVDALTAYGFDTSGKGVDKARPVALSATLPTYSGAK